jgi:SOS-response transcriptional repressor LexA
MPTQDVDPKEMTKRQREVYREILLYASAMGRMPTFRDIIDIMGLSSTNALRCHIEAMKKKGVIESTESGRIVVPALAEATKTAAWKLLEEWDNG